MKINYNDFAEKVKLKDNRFSGMDNATVAKTVIKENPYYEDKVDFEETAKDKVLGTGRAIGQAVTVGQAPHLAGVGQALGGAVYNLTHLKNPLKDLYKDYKEGREEYKKEQNKFETLHPGLNFAGEAVGTVGALPIGGAAAKIPQIAKLLKGAGAVKKGALAGTSWGAAYGAGQGLSNTEGKAFDLPKAATGLGAGALVGGTIGTAIPLSVLGVKGGIKGLINGANALTKTGLKGNVQQYTVPEGVQTKTYRKLATNPVIQKEALRGDIGMRAEELQNKATDKMLNFVPEKFEKISKEYEALPKDIFISFDKNNTTGKMLQAVKDFQFNTKFMPNESAEKNVNNLVQKIIKSGRTVNNEYGITRENLQRAMDTVYEQSQKAFKDGDNAVGKLYKDLYGILKEARATNKKVEEVSAKYADISRVKEMLEQGLGVKWGKGDNHRQVSTKLIQQARNRAGTQFDEILVKADEILKKYPDLEGAKDLSNAIDLAQVAYDFRPPEESKFTNRVLTPKGIFNKTFNAIFTKSPQEKAKLLAKNLQEGRITPQDVTGEFDIVNGGRFTTGLNRFLQRQKVYGGKLNPIAALMRKKKTNTPLPRLLLADSSQFNNLIRNPLILEINKNKKSLLRSNKNGNTNN